MTEDNFKWTDELVREVIGIAHKDGYESIQETNLDKLLDIFKQSKLQSQDKPQPSSIDRIEATKPPLGIMPQWVWRELRLKDLDEAINRYKDAHKEIPQEWINERYHLEQAINGKECLFNVDAINKRLDELKDSKWVKSKGAGTLRFVTRKVSDKIFEDDGLISGQPPSKSCHYDKYEDLTKEEEVAAWCGYMARQPLQFYSPEKTYTQSEVDTIRKEAFEAARETKPRLSFMAGLKDIKYEKFEDYLNSLSTPTTQPKEEDKPVKTEWFVNSYWEVHSKAQGSHHPADAAGNKYFPTKEAAEQYILENKPCLSLNEVKELANNNGAKVLCIPDEKISNYAKQKQTKQ